MMRISNLSFSYQSGEVLAQASVDLPSSGIIAIIGDNGSGKTTLIRLLLGELQSDDGSIRLDGRIGYLPQDSEDIKDKSGGERTKLLLERIFAQNPDILLLDEPTNNLDAEAKLWLQDQLIAQHGLILVVSHDRDFMNQIADYILEVKAGKLTLFSGNYNEYLARIAQRKQEQISLYEKAHKSATKAKQRLRQTRIHNDQINHSRFNKIRNENKMVFQKRKNNAQNTAGKITHATRTKLNRLSKIEKPHERKTYQTKLSADFLHRRRLLKISNLAKSYDSKQLFASLNLELFTSERLRIGGKNGAGKTTLFKIILGEAQPDSGEVALAPNLRIGYIAQDVYGLDLEQSFLAQVDAESTSIYQAATTMDITPTDLQLPCRMLSRGQLMKLAFLKIVLTPMDLLILDEPTNHLDVRARENIENALADYAGAILLATHDEILAIKVCEGKMIRL